MRLMAATILALSLLPCSAVAQQPASADNGPTLAVTMQFIQDKLKEFGNVDYTIVAFGRRYPHKSTLTEVSADPNTCAIRYSGTGEALYDDGWKRTVYTNTIPLKDVSTVSVAIGPMSEPPVYWLQLTIPKGSVALHYSEQTSADGKKYKKGQSKDENSTSLLLELRDQEIANRVANALRRAVALCMPPAPPAVDNRKKPGDPF
jgi:hypothetical protein